VAAAGCQGVLLLVRRTAEVCWEMKQWFISDHQRVDQLADSPVSSRALTAGTRTAASAAAEAAVRPAAPVEDIQVIRDMSILMIKKATVAHIYYTRLPSVGFRS